MQPALPTRPIPPALPPAPTAAHHAAAPPPAPVRGPVYTLEPAHHASGSRSHRLMLTGVAAAVLGLMLTVLWPTTESPSVAVPDVPSDWVPPPAGAPGFDPDATASIGSLPPSTPAASSSVAGVSSSRPQVSRRATPAPSSTRSGSPSQPAAPSTRPSSSPSRPASPPPTTRPTEPQDLTPLPGWRERELRSVSGGAETSIEFVNLRSRSVIVYWLDHHGQRRQYAVLQPSASYRQHTYVGHPWVVTDRRGHALVCFQPTRTPARAVIR
jgi:hypothetical protein